jgi:hypothetical protein
MDREPARKRPEGNTDDVPARKVYRKPALIAYGSIAKLTRTGGATRAEVGVPAMRMAACL